jgi:hypothetical protein
MLENYRVAALLMASRVVISSTKLIRYEVSETRPISFVRRNIHVRRPNCLAPAGIEPCTIAKWSPFPYVIALITICMELCIFKSSQNVYNTETLLSFHAVIIRLKLSFKSYLTVMYAIKYFWSTAYYFKIFRMLLSCLSSICWSN